MRIGEAARRAGVRASTIRYYEAVGVLPAPPRVSGQRRYDGSILRRLAVIDIAQRAGLSLDEIADLLARGGDPIAGRLRRVAEGHLPEIDALIECATRARAWLEAAAGCSCRTIDDCALFDETMLPLPDRPQLRQAVRPGRL